MQLRCCVVRDGCYVEILGGLVVTFVGPQLASAQAGGGLRKGLLPSASPCSCAGVSMQPYSTEGSQGITRLLSLFPWWGSQ